MDLNFIDRTLRTSGIVSIVILIFGSFYYGFNPSLSVFTGIIWGMVNLYFLSLLIRATLRPEGADKMSALVLLFIKIPLLYFTGYLMVTSPFFNPLLLLAGFSVVLVVIVLKAAGRALLGLDQTKAEKGQGSVSSA